MSTAATTTNVHHEMDRKTMMMINSEALETLFNERDSRMEELSGQLTALREVNKRLRSSLMTMVAHVDDLSQSKLIQLEQRIERENNILNEERKEQEGFVQRKEHELESLKQQFQQWKQWHKCSTGDNNHNHNNNDNHNNHNNNDDNNNDNNNNDNHNNNNDNYNNDNNESMIRVQWRWEQQEKRKKKLLKSIEQMRQETLELKAQNNQLQSSVHHVRLKHSQVESMLKESQLSQQYLHTELNQLLAHKKESMDNNDSKQNKMLHIDKVKSEINQYKALNHQMSHYVIPDLVMRQTTQRKQLLILTRQLNDIQIEKNKLQNECEQWELKISKLQSVQNHTTSNSTDENTRLFKQQLEQVLEKKKLLEKELSELKNRLLKSKYEIDTRLETQLKKSKLATRELERELVLAKESERVQKYKYEQLELQHRLLNESIEESRQNLSNLQFQLTLYDNDEDEEEEKKT
jgi:hypothetical protein